MSTAVISSDAIASLQAHLPEPPIPLGSYVAVVRVGNLLYTSGVLPMKDGKLAVTGAVSDDTIEQAREAARLCVLNTLSLIRHELGGTLLPLRRVIKLTGFVSSLPDFYEQPQVLNAASDFLVEHLGDAGRHVRSAVGVSALPKNASVELEMVVEIMG